MRGFTARGLVIASASLLPFAAHAQEAPGAAVPAAAAQPQETAGVDDIVVTAQRRSENLQKVPISITALSSEKLAQLNIGSTEGLQIATPGLQYTNSGGFPQPFIRGVGNDRSANSEASVATYIDGVYIAFSAGTTQDLYDIERVEVLRGPQGTLYGRNATGGAINIVTAKPQFEFGARASATYRNYGLKKGAAYITGPLSSTLAMSVALSARDQDSFHRNISTRKAPNFQENESGVFGRAKLLWQPSPNFQAVAAADFGESYSFDATAYRQIQPNAIGFSLGGVTGSKPFDVALGLQTQSKVKQRGLSLNMNADLRAVNLVSITGYRLTKQYPQIELGGTDVTVQRADIHPTRSEQFSQEVQLQSGKNMPFSWILGGYFFKETQANEPYETTVVRLVAGTPTTLTHTLTNIKAITDSWSVFGQVTVPITDQLKITGGARYTWEHREIPGFTVTNLLPAVPTTTAGAGREAQFNKFTYRLGIDYQVTPNILLYASNARGFKAGIFNLSNTADLGPVQPEILTSYEVGAKLDLFDRIVRLNLSAYHYDFKNLQVTIVAIGTGATILRNAAAARMNGGEAELTIRPSNRFQLSATASLLDAKYTDFPNFPALNPAPAPGTGNVATPTNLSGAQVMRSPPFTASVSADYSIPIGSGNIRLGGVFYHNSGFKFDPAGRGKQQSYDTVDASIAYGPANKSWELSAWTKNLFDKRYYSVVQLNGTGTNVAYAPPFTAGVTLNVKFGSGN